MTEQKLAEIYDSLSDHDKKCVGMIGISFVAGLHERILSVIERTLYEKNN